MSDIATEARRKIARDEYERRIEEAQRALESYEPETGAQLLRAAADSLEELADITEFQSKATEYEHKAQEYRTTADSLEAEGMSAVASVDRAGEPRGEPADRPQRPRSDPSPEGRDELAVNLNAPDLTFEDVGGMEDLKRTLHEEIGDPITQSELYEQYGIDPTRGVLLQGPPGTGKTYITRAFAGEMGWNFIELSPADVTSALVGEAAKNIQEVFETAKANQPCILFFDEIDSIATSRVSQTQGTQSEQQMLTQLLQEINDLGEADVIVFAATNAPEEVDDALLRAGRLTQTIEVPLPDADARKAILRVHLRDRPVPTRGIDYAAIAEATAGFSAADMEPVANGAALRAAQAAEETGSIVPITQTHLEAAIEQRRQSKDDAASGGGYLTDGGGTEA